MDFKIFIFYFLLVFTVVTFASGVLFYRVSVKYIDKHMEKDGVSPPGWDKGIGASVSFYIFAMFLNVLVYRRLCLTAVLSQSTQEH